MVAPHKDVPEPTQPPINSTSLGTRLEEHERFEKEAEEERRKYMERRKAIKDWDSIERDMRAKQEREARIVRLIAMFIVGVIISSIWWS